MAATARTVTDRIKTEVRIFIVVIPCVLNTSIFAQADKCHLLCSGQQLSVHLLLNHFR